MTTRPAGARAHLAASTLLALALGWSAESFATALPVLYVSVNGGAAVSFENDQVCDGTKAVQCFGTGAAGDLLISSFELTADPDPYVTGAFNFYNSSLSTISVVATVLFPVSGTYESPDIALESGLVNNVFGGGIFNLVIEGLVDPPGSPLLSITEASPGVPFSVCEDPGFDPGCQQDVIAVGEFQGGAPSLAVLSNIGLRISFDLTGDTTATIGLDPNETYSGAAYFSVTPGPVVPVPAAVWLFGSALGAMGWLRRKTAT